MAGALVASWLTQKSASASSGIGRFSRAMRGPSVHAVTSRNASDVK